MSKHRLLALVIILIAFALRVHALDKVWHDVDTGWPHGLAIETLESILDGHYQDPAPHLYNSTLGLPNPLGAVYLWMLVALFDRSAYTAFAIAAMLNVLAVAMTFDLARRLFGRSPAIVAAVLAASSTWGIWIGRTTNLPGLLEFSAVASAWLVMTALKRVNARQLVGGFALTAVVMQTYAVALGLVGQIAVVALVAWPSTRKLLRFVAAGFVLLAVSAAIQLVPFMVSRMVNPVTALGAFPVQSETIPNPFGIHLNLGAFDHALRMVSGRDFQSVQLDHDAPDFALQNTLGNVRAGIVDALMLAGTLVAIVRSRRDMGSRMVLTWFLVPTLTATVLMAIFTTLHTTFYYMPIASPAGYLLAAVPFMALDHLDQLRIARSASPMSGFTRAASGAILGLACVAQIGVTSSHLIGYTVFVAHEPPPQEMPRGPLSWHIALHNLWYTQCTEVDDSWPRYWMVSVLQSAHSLRPGTSRTSGNSDVWDVSPRGGNCTMRLTGPAPAWATPIPLQFTDQIRINIYRSLPIGDHAQLFPDEEPAGTRTLQSVPGSNTYVLVNAIAPLQVNLNWTLVDLASTPSASPGDMITISQAMRIDALPQDSHWNWYFAPFVTLSTADDRALVSIDNAPAIEGSIWRPGDIIISNVRLKVPADAVTGVYKLKISLFDPNQKVNAVFFAPGAPDKPIVNLVRSLTITARAP